MPNLAKIVRSLPPEKLNQLLDVDVWRAPAAGADAVFDAERFGDWLHALIEDGVEAGAQKLTDLDFQVVIAGFSRHVAVLDHAAVSSYVTLDGELVEGREPEGKARADVGGYVVVARRTSAWDTIVDLLAELASSQSTYFHRLMRECVDLSNGAREADGFHSLMDDDDQAMFDLSVERDTRREEQGYVSPADARAFLEAARHTPLGRAATQQPALVSTTSAKYERVRAHIGSQPDSESELAFLANTLISGCSIQGRAFEANESRDAALAICNLGFENWPAARDDRSLKAAFQIGFAVLHQQVGMLAARRLLDAITGLETSDHQIQFDLAVLRRELRRAIADGTPWSARNRLDVLLILDTPGWGVLSGLLDQCPVMQSSFISNNTQIAEICRFLDAPLDV